MRIIAPLFHSRALSALAFLTVVVGCGESGPVGTQWAALEIRTDELVDGFRGRPYQQALEGSGGDLGGGYAWSLEGGSLPAGLILEPATGKLVGVPTAGGSNFTIGISSADGQFASRDFSVEVETPCSERPDTDVVTMEDANLAASLRLAAGLDATDSLTCGALSGIASLDVRDGGQGGGGAHFVGPIETLHGIQHLSGLEELVVGYGWAVYHDPDELIDMSGLEALSTLRRLEFLSLDHPPAACERLSHLTELRFLRLGLFPNPQRSSFADASFLAPLTQLEELHAPGFLFTDLSVLAAFEQLRVLNIYNNCVADLDFVRGMSHLVTLDAGFQDGTCLEDIGGLAGLVDLGWLSIGGNPGVEEFGALANLPALSDDSGCGVTPRGSLKTVSISTRASAIE